LELEAKKKAKEVALAVICPQGFDLSETKEKWVNGPKNKRGDNFLSPRQGKVSI
jgi:hypothetical protein